MTAMSTDETLLFQELDEIETPCTYIGDRHCSGGKAEWILYKHCPHCNDQKMVLSCTPCKTARMTSDDGVICMNGKTGAGCRELVAPARHMYSRVEPL